MRITTFFFLPLFLALSFSGFAQTKHTLSGTVRDAKNGEELIGATVTIKEIPNTGGVTNA